METCEKSGCQRKPYAKGLCRPCYQTDPGRKRPKPRRDTDERFDEKWTLDPETGCHVWHGARIESGHGVFWLDGKNIGAYRYAYIRKHGPVASGLHLDHFVCENPPCCNPDHVRPVPPRENWLRGRSVSANNLRKSRCPQGHPYSTENTYITRDGFRQCRECKRLKALAKYVHVHPSSRRRGPYRTKRSRRDFSAI